MVILTSLWKGLVNIVDSRWFRLGYATYIALFSAFLALYIFLSAFTTPNTQNGGDWAFVGMFLALMVSPLAVNWFLDDSQRDVEWRIRIQQIMRFGMTFSLGWAGIMWYLEPGREHLEPATVLLGFAVAYTTYQIDKNSRKLETLENVT